MPIIEARELRKEFRVFKTREGVWGTVRDLFHDVIRKIVNEVPVRDIYVEAEPIEEIVKTIYSRGLSGAR